MISNLILITHFHGDHFGGLPFLLLDAQFTRRTRPLIIAGPEGIEMRLTQLMEALFENSSKTKQRFDLSVVALKPEETRTFGAVDVTPYPVVHGESGGARRRPVHRRGLLLRQGGEKSPQPENAGGAPRRDQAEAAGAHAYERGHARAARYA